MEPPASSSVGLFILLGFFFLLLLFPTRSLDKLTQSTLITLCLFVFVDTTYFQLNIRVRLKPKMTPNTYLSPNPCRCCPINRITSSSDWDSRFFFFIEPVSEPKVVAVEVAGLLDVGTPLFAVTTVPLFVGDSSPFECAPATADDSPFWALFRQDSSEFCPCPAPLACMLQTLVSVPLCRLRQRAEIARGLGREAKPKTAAERPALPAEAPVSPAPSAADTRAFFRGGEAPPGSESLEEQAEARVTLLGTSVTRRPQTCLLLLRLLMKYTAEAHCGIRTFFRLRMRSPMLLLFVRTAASPLWTSRRDDVTGKP